jgi:hypothetical protein
MNNKMVNGVVGGAVVEVDRRESESKGCGVFYPFGLAPPSVDTYVLWCVDRGRHRVFAVTENVSVGISTLAALLERLAYIMLVKNIFKIRTF